MKGPSPAVPIERIARVVVVLASVWFGFTALWGVLSIPGGGHLGAGSAGNVMAAEQMVRWHIVYPAWDWYTGQPPPKISYICHHPFGQYWVPAVLLWVFGHRDFIVHLPPALMSIAIPPLLYGIAREKWGAATGAVAAAAYVVLPISVGFSQFLNLETFCIFGALLFFWGHTRHMVTGKRRHLVASLIGLAFACSGDWAGYLLVAPTLAWALLRAFVLPVRLTPRFKLAPYARWWALSVALAVGSLVLWLALFYKAEQLAEWMSAAQARRGGEGVKLETILETRKNWIDFSFTPLAIKLGKLAAPVCLVRLLVTRRDEETYSLGLLFGATIQYVAFTQGADVHIFWSHYFAPYFALALAQVVHAIGAGVGLAVRRFAPRRGATVAALVTLVLGLLPVLAMTHDGVLSLWVWRRTGGRYDDKGSLIRSHLDMLAVLEQVVLPRTMRGTPIDTHPSANWGWEHQWKYQGLANTAGVPGAGNPSAASHPFWIARGSAVPSDEQKKIAGIGHLRIYGDTWLVDQREAPGPLDAYSLNEREPNPLQWLLFDPTEPHRIVGSAPDPWLTWEWRTHLGQDAAPPAGQPSTLDEIRIAHNAALARGDEAAAERWREQIDRQLDRTVETRFEPGGLRLIGVRLTGGVQPRIESWFEVGAPFEADDTFAVKSVMEQPSGWTLIPPDKTDREMAWPTSLPTRLWKPRFLYTTVTVMNHRIGRERYWGRWSGSSAPHRADNRPETTLAEVR
ncbi:MAG TPA: glycosyltransferase family 39 protein [Polyangiaceae bacterium]|jgi:hypothetical protein